MDEPSAPPQAPRQTECQALCSSLGGKQTVRGVWATPKRHIEGIWRKSGRRNANTTFETLTPFRCIVTELQCPKDAMLRVQSPKGLQSDQSTSEATPMGHTRRMHFIRRPSMSSNEDDAKHRHTRTHTRENCQRNDARSTVRTALTRLTREVKNHFVSIACRIHPSFRPHQFSMHDDERLCPCMTPSACSSRHLTDFSARGLSTLALHGNLGNHQSSKKVERLESDRLNMMMRDTLDGSTLPLTHHEVGKIAGSCVGSNVCETSCRV